VNFVDAISVFEEKYDPAPTWILLAPLQCLWCSLAMQRSQEIKLRSSHSHTCAETARPGKRRDTRFADEDAQGNRLFLRKLGTIWTMSEPERQNVDIEKVNGVIEPLVSTQV